MRGTAGDNHAGFDAMRGAVAAAMSRSKRETPHCYLTETIDLSVEAPALNQTVKM